MALRDYLTLALTDGIGPILVKRLIESTGSAEEACSASVNRLQMIEGIGAAKARKIQESMRAAAAQADEELDKARKLGVTILCPDDEAYPMLLRSITDPPPALYVKGALEARDLNALAVVGSRKCSHYGREQAERFAALLAGAGFTIASGGARGVDSAAHRGAMMHPQGRTVAVLGCGVDVTYPPENGALFKQIVERGAVVSEYPLGTPPLAENFIRRNRIISGLSRGVLVVEADERSGALTTARFAADDHNRPVFALPGRVDNALSVGPHKLIREGAILTQSLDHILEGLGPLPDEATQPSLFTPPTQDSALSTQDLPTPPPVTLTDRQSRILEALSHEPMSIDLLIDRTELSANEILQEMTLLTLKGQVTRVDGQTFARRKFIKT